MSDKVTEAPMQTTEARIEFDVEVVRTSYSRATIRVKAATPDEALAKAEEGAPNREFPGAHESLYEALVARRVE